ncbi:MAG TPA: alpha/beta hydrolase-fold protein [Actinomycetota bacterium]|nr:alpha/beta hydrolase-fold protein [Actinomycetota bacterium]
MRSRAIVSVMLVLGLVAAGSAIGAPAGPGPLAFRVSFAADVLDQPATGRVFVIVSTNPDPEPRFQVDILGPPFWGKDVTDVTPGQNMVLGSGGGVVGYPLDSPVDLPEGDYTVQAFLNVYTTFTRSDGSVVQLHMPCGDGGYFLDSPGNLVGTPVQLHLGPDSGTVDLTLDRVIPPADPVPDGGTCQQGNPADSEHVKHVKIRSDLLTAFWGTPIYIGADVLLPEGFDASAPTRYPVIYLQGHYPSENPFGFLEDGSNGFSKWWLSGRAPKVIVVQLRHENPYFDDSYAVNSANLGPYGDAIVTELIPALQHRFRMVPKPWARTLTGGSTGGWEALAQQVYYPSFYGGAWPLCPDPVDFRFHQLVNIYRDDNAYATLHDWEEVPRPSARTVAGDTIWTMEQENHWEMALGSHGRSQLGQWDIWQAVYGPQGDDGYPAPIWDKATGEIDHAVARRWREKDIRRYLATHWSSVGPKLVGKIHIWVGDDDTFFLNDAVELLQRFLEGAEHPAANAEFHYGHNRPHCWGPTDIQLVQMMAGEMAQVAPPGADVGWMGPRIAPSVATASSAAPYGRRASGRL